MDSGNSGSFQSSSGEDEFDSHGNGISALLNNNPTGDHVVVSHSNHHQPPPPPPRPPPTTASSYMYHNPLSNYFDLVSPPQPLQNHPNNTLLINSDVDWLKTLRSDTDINTFQGLLDSQNQAENTTVSTTTLISPPPQQPPPTSVGKNPRKRSRASRRAPTTVLTTDTSNFRAMVQEFTGIPTTPFSSTPLSTNRFDLFNRASSNMRYTDSYNICKPFPQKIQLGSSSNIDHAIIASSNSNSNTLGMNINANNNPPSFNYYHNNPPQTSSHFNLQNPFVSSFLDPNTNPFPPSTKTHQESLDISPNDSHMNMNTNTHPNLIFSDLTTLRNNDQDGVSWQNNGVNSSQDDDQNNFNFPS